MKIILQWSTLGLKLFVEKVSRLYKSAGDIEKYVNMDLHTFWAILAGYKKDRYLIVDDKVIITALII